MPTIKRKYPKIDAKGITDILWENSNEEQLYPKPSYNFTIPEWLADLLGFYPDERGHRDDRVKLISHPTHPDRGEFKGYYQYDLSDFGMNDPNYTLFGLVDNDQDPQAVVTHNGGLVLPEITVTPNGNYYMNTYDNIKLVPKKR